MFTALLLLLGVVGTHLTAAMPSPSRGCPPTCKPVNASHHFIFKHPDSSISSTSVAPWTLQTESEPGREPQHIRRAVCGSCTVSGMTAEPIYINISVYKRQRSGGEEVICKCPYKLSVGCTCVNNQ